MRKVLEEMLQNTKLLKRKLDSEELNTIDKNIRDDLNLYGDIFGKLKSVYSIRHLESEHSVYQLLTDRLTNCRYYYDNGMVSRVNAQVNNTMTSFLIETKKLDDINIDNIDIEDFLVAFANANTVSEKLYKIETQANSAKNREFLAHNFDLIAPSYVLYDGNIEIGKEITEEEFSVVKYERISYFKSDEYLVTVLKTEQGFCISIKSLSNNNFAKLLLDNDNNFELKEFEINKLRSGYKAHFLLEDQINLISKYKLFRFENEMKMRYAVEEIIGCEYQSMISFARECAMYIVYNEL